ncbi:signal peptidase I [Streptomyces harbinensis]|uniref:signal peptidase I n=1 Tax=Streptomyces harbinensis TaxID=1176198 RepID=UPI0033982DB8
MSGAPRGGVGRRLSQLAVALGCVLFVGGFALGALLYQPYAVPTDSMHPVVAAGDRVLAQRIEGRQVRRGDVVVFREAAWGDAPMIKRVVGVGGDTVACCDPDGLLLVNGEPVVEPYLDPRWSDSPTSYEVRIPEGELFLLGDQRLASVDSRDQITDVQAGSVPAEAVTARVEATLWPLGSVGLLPRPTGFAGLPGGISGSGPLVPLCWAIGAGLVLILAGGLYGPLARRSSRSGHRRVPKRAGEAQ